MTAPRVAYLVNQYPKVSHSFIRREILALERRGYTVQRIALRGWDGPLVDADDLAERERTQYVLQHGAKPLLRAMFERLRASPSRFFKATMLALRMGLHADRPLPLHLVYLAEACLIAQWLEAAGAQHLHAHFGTNPAEVAMLVAALGGPAYSFTVHGPEEFDKPQFLGLGEKCRRAAFVVAISSFGRSQLYRWVEHVHWPKIAVVHCGLEPAFHADADSGADAAALGGTRLVCVGRLCEQKGQLLLVAAAHRLAREGVDFQLVLAGDGEMRGEIETLIATHALQDRVRITGWISSAQVRTELLASRAMVLPSFAEGLPVSVMEAMALRRPVLTTSIAGIPELVRDGESGWLFSAGSVDELTDALREALAQPADVLIRMGDAARERVLARHDIDTEAAKLAALFQGAVSGAAVVA